MNEEGENSLEAKSRYQWLESELSKRKKELDSAITRYSEVRAELNGFPDAYVSSYAMYVEHISPFLVQEGATSGFVVVPVDQSGSTSRGLFEFGADSYTRLLVRAVE